MTNSLVLVTVVGIVSMTSVWPATASGNNSVHLYEQMTRALAEQAHVSWQRGTAASRSSTANSLGTYGVQAGNRAESQQAAIENYVATLATAMKPSPKVAHIPEEHPVSVDLENPEKKWTKYYAEAKNSLRPNIPYQWQSNSAQHPVKIRLTEEHIATLKANFDVLMWYRNELDEVSNGSGSDGATHFKRFLDHFVANLLEGLPGAPKIDLDTGTVSGDKWELDEQNLREQLIMAYRFLVAKHQIYPDYDQFGPADRELLVSMMKIAYLVGARMDPNWFEQTKVNLKQVSKRTQWKKPIVNALASLQTREGQGSESDQPAVISIPPPQPKPTPAAPQPQPQQQKVEIIIRSEP